MVPSNTIRKRLPPSKRYILRKVGDKYTVHDTIGSRTFAKYDTAAEARALRDRLNRSAR